jgi:hypothetical protein
VKLNLVKKSPIPDSLGKGLSLLYPSHRPPFIIAYVGCIIPLLLLLILYIFYDKQKYKKEQRAGGNKKIQIQTTKRPRLPKQAKPKVSVTLYENQVNEIVIVFRKIY